MKKNVLLLLLCSLSSAFILLAACKESRTAKKPPPVLSAEEQSAEKYNAWRRSTEAFFGDFSSRWRQVNAIIQQDYDFSRFYYFSDDLEALQQRLTKASELPAAHPLDNLARDYLNAINALLPLDKQLSDYSNRQSWREDGGASIATLGRQLLPLLKAAAAQQQAFTAALRQSEDQSLLATLQKYPQGSVQRHRLYALYYARRIYQGFMQVQENAENAGNGQNPAIPPQLVSDIQTFERNTKDYIRSMPENGSCEVFMNTLIDLLGDSRSMLQNFANGDYLRLPAKNAAFNTALIRRNNDLLILKRHYLKVIDSYNQGGC